MQPQRRKPELAEVKIDVRQVIDTLHEKYQGLLGQVLAENANLQVGFETAQAEIAALRAQNVALREQMGVTNVSLPPSAARPSAAEG